MVTDRTAVNAGGTMTAFWVCFWVFAGLRISVCRAQAAAPAVYMMGDSLVDVGNNNYLPFSIAKANFPHNGVDFPTGNPTGRFCNGKNVADFLAEKLGLPTSPPYLSLLGEPAPITGNQTISLAEQVEYFSRVRDKLIQELGPSGAQVHLSKSLFTIVIGSNDLFAYFRKLSTGSTVSKQYTTQQVYVDMMLSTYKGLLKKLYELGARKVVVAGVGAIGCCPAKRKMNKTGGCNDEMNNWSTNYNDGLKIMLQQLKSESPGLNYAYFNTYAAMVNLFQNPETYGFKDIKEACCGLGNLNADLPCIPIASYCSNRTNHIFWDRNHPTEAVDNLFSHLLYSGSQEYMIPMNVQQLIAV